MKKLINRDLSILVLCCLLFSACNKTNDIASYTLKPPVAVAGADTIITLPTRSTKLDAGKSYDPDGTPLIYEWKILKGPGTSYILKPNNALTEIVNLDTGYYSIELMVTNKTGIGLSSKDTLIITVSKVGPNNGAPKANAGTDYLITLPVNSITLDGSGSTDPDQNIAGYSWTKIEGPVAYSIAYPNNIRTTVTGLLEGTYRFELKVTDLGDLFSLDTVQVTVLPAKPPAIIAHAGGQLVVTIPPEYFFLHGSFDSFGGGGSGGLNYEWKNLAGPTIPTIETKNSSDTKVEGLIPGDYTFELTVTNSVLNLSDKDTVAVNVLAYSGGLNEVIIKNLNWECDWDCTITVANFSTLIPPKKGFLVYLRGETSDWTLIQSAHQIDWRFGIYDNPYYNIKGGKLIVWGGNNFLNKREIKIVY